MRPSRLSSRAALCAAVAVALIVSVDLAPAGAKKAARNVALDAYCALLVNDDAYAPCARAKSPITTVDGDDPLGTYNSMAIGQDGNPVISYFDEDDGDLRVAKCNDPACSGGNEKITKVDTEGNVGAYTSLAIGNDGFPVISYWDVTNNAIKLVKCNDTACAKKTRTINTVVTGGGDQSSMTLGTDGFPVIAYLANTTHLFIVKCNDVSCSGDDETVGDYNHGLSLAYTSTAIGADGDPIVSFYSNNQQDLYVLKCNDPGCVGGDETESVVDATPVVTGKFSSIAIGTDGLPVISYQDEANSALKVAACNDEACAGGNETLTTVDNIGSVGQFTSITIGQDGNPVVTYIDGGDHNLKVARCNDPKCSVPAAIATVDSDGAIDQQTSVVIGTDGRPVIAYVKDGTLAVARL